MISYIELDNFVSFEHLEFDFCGKRNKPKHFILIYGENGAGKSNLISSLLCLSETFMTLTNQDRFNEFTKINFVKELEGLKDKDFKEEILSKMFNINFMTLKGIIESYEPIQYTEPMQIKIGFQLDGKDGEYLVKFHNHRVVFESLTYTITKRKGMVFKIDQENGAVLNSTIFENVGFKNNCIDSVEKYWGMHTFMSILYHEQKTKNKEYIEKNISKQLLDIMGFFNGISVLYKKGNNHRATIAIPFKVMENLVTGTTKHKKDRELDMCENMLNLFFLQLYPDVKKVYYSYIKQDEGYKYTLYFKKIMNGKIVNIPFEKESTGTHKLLDIFPFLLAAANGHIVFIDEMDSGIHDLLIVELIRAFKEKLKGQFIATTHNTLLMNSVDCENICILNIDSEGNKELVTMSEYDFRVQKNNNVQKKYLNGDFGGIPYVNDVDFDEIVDVISSR